MKQLLILSGKGGTGKTTVAGAFVKLLQAKAYADCDVDAPNLHLTMKQQYKPQTEDFYGLSVAVIERAKCTNCGWCMANCRFDAITHDNGMLSINKYACEGCGVCAAACPAKAVDMKPDPAGKLMLYRNNGSVFSTAQLNIGKGTSGMLVTEVKKRMKNATPPDADIIIIDGSPGIGCPVIASLSGVDMTLIVAEPSVSGINDMERIIKTARHFDVKFAVCVNKYDTNIQNSERIKEYCFSEGLSFVGVIPYDTQAIKAINEGLSIVDVDCQSGRAVKNIFNNTVRLLRGETDESKRTV